MRCMLMTVHSEWKTFSGKTGDFRVYIAEMAHVEEQRPTVIVIQEIWGVDDHIQDVARRFAAAGYIAIAPDLFAQNGIRPDELREDRLAFAKGFLHSIPHTAWFNPDEREQAILSRPSQEQDLLRETLNGLFRLLDPKQSGEFVETLIETASYARHHYEKSKGMPVTSVGFCMGGALSAVLATRDPDHDGSIVFYGRPPANGIANIQCPVLGFYGGQDPNITHLVPDFEKDMHKEGKAFEAIIYQEANHAFFNDTNPTYNVTYARDAFARSLSFLNQIVSR